MQKVQNSAGCAQVTVRPLLGCSGARRWKRNLASAVARRADSTAGLYQVFSSSEGIQPLSVPADQGILRSLCGCQAD